MRLICSHHGLYSGKIFITREINSFWMQNPAFERNRKVAFCWESVHATRSV